MNQEIINQFVVNAHGNFAKVKEMAAEYGPEILNKSAVWDETALGAAAHTASKEIATWLLEQGVPLDIFAAAILGKTEAFKAFVDEAADLPNLRGAHGIPILFYPVIAGNREFAELLLSRGVEVNTGAGGNTALHGAAWFNQPEMAEWLIGLGADVNVKDYQGKTPLAIAVENNRPAVAEVLRRNGASE